jgi:hypothetical protein
MKNTGSGAGAGADAGVSADARSPHPAGGSASVDPWSSPAGEDLALLFHPRLRMSGAARKPICEGPFEVSIWPNRPTHLYGPSHSASTTRLLRPQRSILPSFCKIKKRRQKDSPYPRSRRHNSPPGRPCRHLRRPTAATPWVCCGFLRPGSHAPTRIFPGLHHAPTRSFPDLLHAPTLIFADLQHAVGDQRGSVHGSPIKGGHPSEVS